MYGATRDYFMRYNNMTKEEKTSQALYRVANVGKYLGCHTKDLEKLYIASKINEQNSPTKEAQDFYSQRQVDIMVALFVRRFYGLMG